MLRIIQISDLHFSSLSFSLKQFLSKHWIGNLNLLFFRRYIHIHEQIYELLKVFSHLKADYLVITGDLSTTSQKKEFILAKEFLVAVEKMNIIPLTIPGNHDHYTKKAFYQKLFYEHFTNPRHKEHHPLKEFCLKDHGVEARPLDNRWWFVGIDTAVATSLISSQGHFSAKIEEMLDHILSSIPSDKNIILVNHFPFLDIQKRKNLKRGAALKKMLAKYKNVKLYLHGHTHKHELLDLRKEKLPIVLNSGSVSSKRSGYFHVLDINEQVKITVYKWNHGWKEKETHKYVV